MVSEWNIWAPLKSFHPQPYDQAQAKEMKSLQFFQLPEEILLPQRPCPWNNPCFPPSATGLRAGIAPQREVGWEGGWSNLDLVGPPQTRRAAIKLPIAKWLIVTATAMHMWVRHLQLDASSHWLPSRVQAASTLAWQPVTGSQLYYPNQELTIDALEKNNARCHIGNSTGLIPMDKACFQPITSRTMWQGNSHCAATLPKLLPSLGKK